MKVMTIKERKENNYDYNEIVAYFPLATIDDCQELEDYKKLYDMGYRYITIEGTDDEPMYFAYKDKPYKVCDTDEMILFEGKDKIEVFGDVIPWDLELGDEPFLVQDEIDYLRHEEGKYNISLKFKRIMYYINLTINCMGDEGFGLLSDKTLFDYRCAEIKNAYDELKLSYDELCELLLEDNKTGKDKEIQLEQWKKIFYWEMTEDNKFFIKDVYGAMETEFIEEDDDDWWEEFNW